METKATATSSESIHLSWQPSQPPTGIIEKYKVRYGPLNEPMVWTTELQVANQTNYCSKKSEKLNFVCIAVPKLAGNTTYLFQVQAFNANVTEGSKFSKSFEATTDPNPPDPNEASKLPPEIIMPALINDHDDHDHVSSSHLVIIIVSFFIILVLIVIVAALVYKIKKNQLKQKYEATKRQMISSHRDSVIISPMSSPPGVGGPQSLNVSALGSFYPSMATIDYTFNNSIAYHVRDIQSRRLPEPPTPKRLGKIRVDNISIALTQIL